MERCDHFLAVEGDQENYKESGLKPVVLWLTLYLFWLRPQKVKSYSRALLTDPGAPLGRLFRSLLTGWHWPEQRWAEGETGPIWVAESSLRGFSGTFLCHSRSEQLLATPFGQRPLSELHTLVVSDF